jgi:hypothetical protein
MARFAIRCHPCAPVAPDELGRWLERQVNELRVEAPHGTIRLLRLTQGPLRADLFIGWLVELDLPEGEPLLAGDHLAQALRDMRLLGLQPTLLRTTLQGEQGLANGSARRPSHFSMWTRDAGP